MTKIRLSELRLLTHIEDGKEIPVLSTGDWSDGWALSLIQTATTMLRDAGVQCPREDNQIWAQVSMDHASELVIGPKFTPGALVAVIAPRRDDASAARPARPTIRHPPRAFALYDKNREVALAFWPLPPQFEV